MADPGKLSDTADRAYAERLQALSGAAWKRWLNVQAPYRWNVRRLELGYTLDVGCGIGRNLAHLGGNGVGVDHNPASIEVCRARGLTAYLTKDFLDSPLARPNTFDALLVAHILEHLDGPTAESLLAMYLPFVKPNGKVVLITPQERGYASDPTHVRFVDFAELRRMARASGLVVQKEYSFPLPRVLGHVMPYNEFVLLARRP